MSDVIRAWHETVALLAKRLDRGERDIDRLMSYARDHLNTHSALTPDEQQQVLKSVRRDIKTFAQGYDEQRPDSLFMRIVRQSLWKELADITDRSQLEWRDLFVDLRHHGVYQSGEVVGLGNLICEKCHFTRAIYTAEILERCPKCGHSHFHREPFTP